MKESTRATHCKTPHRTAEINVAIANESAAVATRAPVLLLEVQTAHQVENSWRTVAYLLSKFHIISFLLLSVSWSRNSIHRYIFKKKKDGAGHVCTCAAGSRYKNVCNCFPKSLVINKRVHNTLWSVYTVEKYIVVGNILVILNWKHVTNTIERMEQVLREYTQLSKTKWTMLRKAYIGENQARKPIL